MTKLGRYACAAIVGLVGLGSTAAAARENELAQCSAGKPSVLVRIHGFKGNVGKVRVQAYGANPRDFLAKGKWIERVETVHSGSSDMTVCVPLPRPGHYAIAVRHDANANGKSDWNDGGGFSRNPKLSMMALKPDHEKVKVEVGNKPLEVDITMQYRQGLKVAPL